MIDDDEFLLGIVDNPDSDYNDGLDGWDNFNIRWDDEQQAHVLTVTFESAEDNSILEGRWALRRI